MIYQSLGVDLDQSSITCCFYEGGKYLKKKKKVLFFLVFFHLFRNVKMSFRLHSDGIAVAWVTKQPESIELKLKIVILLTTKHWL